LKVKKSILNQELNNIFLKNENIENKELIKNEETNLKHNNSTEEMKTNEKLNEINEKIEKIESKSFSIKITDIDQIFQNIIEIMNIHKIFIESLQKMKLNNKLDEKFLILFKLLLKNIKEKYKIYFLGYEDSLKLLDSICSNHSNFEILLKLIKKKINLMFDFNDKSKYDTSLSSLLILPIQRLPRYELLFNQYLDLTLKMIFTENPKEKEIQLKKKEKKEEDKGVKIRMINIDEIKNIKDVDMDDSEEEEIKIELNIFKKKKIKYIKMIKEDIENINKFIDGEKGIKNTIDFLTKINILDLFKSNNLSIKNEILFYSLISLKILNINNTNQYNLYFLILFNDFMVLLNGEIDINEYQYFINGEKKINLKYFDHFQIDNNEWNFLENKFENNFYFKFNHEKEDNNFINFKMKFVFDIKNNFENLYYQINKIKTRQLENFNYYFNFLYYLENNNELKDLRNLRFIDEKNVNKNAFNDVFEYYKFCLNEKDLIEIESLFILKEMKGNLDDDKLNLKIFNIVKPYFYPTPYILDDNFEKNINIKKNRRNFSISNFKN
jgi:hypothetical protein